MTTSIISFIILLISHAAAGIYSSTLKYSKKTAYIVWGIWIALQSALLFLAEYVLTDDILQFIVGFISPFVGQYLIYFLTTKGKLAQRIFTMLSYSIFFCIFMPLWMMVRGTFPNMLPIVNVLIQVVILGAIVAYFLCYVCPLCRAASKSMANGWWRLIIVNVVFLLTVVFSSIFPVMLTSFKDPAFGTYLFLSIAIMAMYPIIFSNINSMSEVAIKREVEMQNQLLLAQIESESRQLEADSHARHDRRHHNLVMLEFVNNNDIESMREYLGNLVKSESALSDEIRYCENITVNTILTVYARRAKENDIAVNVSANVSRNLNVAPQDLVIVVANIFENAINAAEKLKNQKRYVDVSIKDDTKRLVVMAENSCKEKMVFDESCYGIGIRSIISTVNKYDGMYDFSAENGVFSAKVSLNLM